MKWKDVDGSDGVLRYTGVERMRKITEIGKDKQLWGPKLEPQISQLRNRNAKLIHRNFRGDKSWLGIGS
jgi:hypothetical protein